ncbi:hypothetical protein GY45DRAFT_265390 [Cubamyces sp. BRFM 1775]|nr:hypothetical protein GY45DRAFT_265390 [Cubamyces sp. BRFM 1775]
MHLIHPHLPDSVLLQSCFTTTSHEFPPSSLHPSVPSFIVPRPGTDTHSSEPFHTFRAVQQCTTVPRSRTRSRPPQRPPPPPPPPPPPHPRPRRVASRCSRTHLTSLSRLRPRPCLVRLSSCSRSVLSCLRTTTRIDVCLGIPWPVRRINILPSSNTRASGSPFRSETPRRVSSGRRRVRGPFPCAPSSARSCVQACVPCVLAPLLAFCASFTISPGRSGLNQSADGPASCHRQCNN